MKLNGALLRKLIKEELDDMMASGEMGSSEGGKVYTEENIHELEDQAVEELRRLRRASTRGPVRRPSDDEAYEEAGKKFKGIKVMLNRNFGPNFGRKDVEATIVGIDNEYGSIRMKVEYVSPKTGKMVVTTA